jgi:sugar lactone lactonase YvrE
MEGHIPAYPTNLTTGEVSTLAGSGQSGSFDGIGTNALITNPNGMAVNVENTLLYFSDALFNTQQIRKLDLQTGQVNKIKSCWQV